MGIKAGEPQPIIAMNVGTGRCRREEGEMDVVRVRMYSWQFYFAFRISRLLIKGRGRDIRHKRNA
jgi:hypothetical protein